jgi:hypothetical protein
MIRGDMIREGRRVVNHAALLVLVLGSACCSTYSGPLAEDLEARLTLLDQAPEVGGTFRFRVEMTNRGTTRYLYGHQRVRPNPVLEIRTPAGEVETFRGGTLSTHREGPLSINPGESVVLFESLDVAREFDIGRPGRYRVQFVGGGVAVAKEAEVSRFPPYDPQGNPRVGLSSLRVISNKIWVEVGPGDYFDKEALRNLLAPALPEFWTLGDEMSSSLEGRESRMVLTRWFSLQEMVSIPVRFAERSPGADYVEIGEFRTRKVWLGVSPDARKSFAEIRPFLLWALR